MTIASKLARKFDSEIACRSIRPDLEGRLVFSILYNDFIQYSGMSEITAQLKINMKKYGYIIHRRKRELEIIKLPS